jgi:hypothetical protein
MAELWKHAGLRFRVGIVASAVCFGIMLVSLWLFLNQQRWQFAAAIGVALVGLTLAGVQAGEAMGRYQRRLKALGGNTPLTKNLPGN